MVTKKAATFFRTFFNSQPLKPSAGMMSVTRSHRNYLLNNIQVLALSYKLSRQAISNFVSKNHL
jgi:hypothetical protein